MIRASINILLFSVSSFAPALETENPTYEYYHQQVIEAEELICAQNYEAALAIYEELFGAFNFVFVREYQVATQLALHQEDQQKAMQFLRKGILAGWELKAVRKNSFIRTRLDKDDWRALKKDYQSIRNQYEAKLNWALHGQVKKMYARDQWKALGALFRFSGKGRERYAEEKFAPQSEEHMAEFLSILMTYGYPGEKLIGNNYWMSTILSHHNSISMAYNNADTLYPNLRPGLEGALQNGQISPFEFALIDDWYRSVKYDRKEATYGILVAPTETQIAETNQRRAKALLRPVELRAALLEIQHQTGMNFYLPATWY